MSMSVTTRPEAALVTIFASNVAEVGRVRVAETMSLMSSLMRSIMLSACGPPGAVAGVGEAVVHQALVHDDCGERLDAQLAELVDVVIGGVGLVQELDVGDGRGRSRCSGVSSVAAGPPDRNALERLDVGREERLTGELQIRWPTGTGSLRPRRYGRPRSRERDGSHRSACAAARRGPRRTRGCRRR